MKDVYSIETFIVNACFSYDFFVLEQWYSDWNQRTIYCVQQNDAKICVGIRAIIRP